ncbi:MAG: M1 family metallopeptidase [Peptococcaceae bacterium]
MDNKVRIKVIPPVFWLGISVLILYLILEGLTPLKRELIKSLSPEPAVCQENSKTFYNLTVKFCEENYSLECTARINYYNYTAQELEEIYFYLYPKAFENTKPPFDKSYWLRPAASYKPGKVVLEKITAAGQTGDYLVDNTSLKVELPRPLKPGDRAGININYRLFLPQCQGRYGYANQTIQCGNWYPVAAVYEDNQWQTAPYYPLGDPFYSKIADYTVKIILPPGWKGAATGTLEEYSFADGQSLLLYSAENIRDFAWVASKKYQEYVEKSAEPLIRSYVWKGDMDLGRETVKIARQAMSVFNRIYGIYPYKEMKIAEVDFYQGGMEYPQIVYISSLFYQPANRDFLEFTLVHELAHQWWYGVVGNNQVREPWLDEALTNYSVFLYYQEIYGQEEMQQVMQKYLGEPLQVQKPVARPLSGYHSMNEYSRFVYDQGTWVVHDIYSVLGREKFLKVMRRYYQRFSYREATIDDFREIIEEISGQNWHDFFQAKLYNNELKEESVSF